MRQKFWQTYPALVLGLAVFLGALFALKSSWALLPLPLLLTRKTCYMAIVCFLLPLPLLYHFYTFPPTDTHVSGTFHIHSLCKTARFSHGWCYQGMLKTDQGRLHARLYTKKYHAANHDYLLSGVVHTKDGRYYILKKVGDWEPVAHSRSFAEWRFHAKERVKCFIHRRIHKRRAALFLTGMSMGQLEDRVMLQEFGNLGLSHIMAISGFHFALLTLFFHLFLRLFLPAKIEALTLMALLTFYLFFIGHSPSIQRAWIVAMVFLLGQLIERVGRPLNSLGVALVIATLFNPLSTTTLSFQLSFLATAGILLLYPLCNQLLQFLFPKHTLSHVINHSFWGQGYYITSALFREGLALTLAVHLALFPLLLTYFHTLSLNSVVYNLFFPFLTSVGLVLFLLGTALGPLGGWIHALTTWYCEALLTIPEHPPILFKTYYFAPLSPLILPLYLTLLFFFSILYHHKKDKLLV